MLKLRHFRIVGVALSLSACAEGAQVPAAAPSQVPVPAGAEVRVIAFNDLHGYLDAPGDSVKAPLRDGGTAALPVGGVATLAGAVAALKQNHPRNVVVAAGDLVGASPLDSGLFHDEPIIQALNAMGLEFSSVGNHEFDRGRDELLRKQNGGCFPGGERGRDTCVDGDFGGARYQYLAANVIDQASGKPLLPPYAIKSFDDGHGGKITIAFVGLVLKNTPTMVSPAGVAGLRFGDEADSANALLPQLHAQGVNAAVILIHQGGETDGAYNDKSCPGLRGDILPVIDRLDPAYAVVVSAHTHRAYNCRYGGRLLTNAGSYGRFITAIDLRLDGSGAIAGAEADNIAVVNATVSSPSVSSEYPAFEADPAVAQIVARYDALAAPLTGRVVGRISSDLTRQAGATGQSALGGIVADSELEATRAQGAVAALINSGGVRSDLLAAQISNGEQPGEITYGEAYQVLPFGDRLVTLTLSGAQLYALLEQQWRHAGPPRMLQTSAGFTYAWDEHRAEGDKVVPGSLKIEGRPVRPRQHYRITAVDFLATGGDGYSVLTTGTDVVTSALDIDAFTAYLQHHQPLAAPAPERLRRPHE